MTQYWGFVFGCIFGMVAAVAISTEWAIVGTAALVGLVIGHWMDPYTKIGPNSLKD